jgi:hypothetical protein
MDSGNDAAQGFPLSSALKCVMQPKALVVSEGYHYQYLYEQNGWVSQGEYGGPGGGAG